MATYCLIFHLSVTLSYTLSCLSLPVLSFRSCYYQNLYPALNLNFKCHSFSPITIIIFFFFGGEIWVISFSIPNPETIMFTRAFKPLILLLYMLISLISSLLSSVHLNFLINHYCHSIEYEFNYFFILLHFFCQSTTLIK